MQHLRITDDRETKVKVKWVKVHSTEDQRIKLTKQQTYITIGNGKAGDFAKLRAGSR